MTENTESDRQATIIERLKADYQQFPENQSYNLYTEDVYFRDPLNQFRGRDRFENTINFIRTWFRDVRLDLHAIARQGDTIHTDWTLNFTSPVPWQPRIVIPGRSELKLNSAGKIISHIDYWHCSRWSVLQQHFVTQ